MNVREYIRGSWQKSLREKGHRQDGISLPYPYYSPCAQGLFDEFYYWDTCFINKGLLADGNVEGAMLNALNVAYLIEQYGFMPNAAVRGMLNRSQPPLFCIIVLDLLPYCSRTEEARLFAALEREYGFWMRERRLACGLNHYGNSADRTAKLHMAAEAEERFACAISDADRETLGDHLLAECESGWDFSPRFARRCKDFAPIDCNALLYLYECTLAQKAASPAAQEEYRKAAQARRQRLLQFCFDGTKLTDAIPGTLFGSAVSAACMLPFMVGLSSDPSVLRDLLDDLECECGIAACKKQKHDAIYQWDYPNMWAPLVWFCYEALKQTGLHEDAARIAQKYLATVERSFAVTGKLWEKYDAVTGQKATRNEYAETEMLGWTAGVYSVLYDELGEPI